MILKNFKISNDNIGVELPNEEYLDLHNNFVLKNFKYEFTDRSFEINFSKSSGNWVPDYDFDGIQLKFLNVSILRTKELDPDLTNKFPEDDLIVSQIGFTDKNDLEFLGVLTEESLKKVEDPAFVINTENGQAIIVYADNVELEKIK